MKFKKKVNLKRLILITVILMVANYVYSLIFPYRIGLNTTHSIKCRLYIYKPLSKKEIEKMPLFRGEYVLFQPPIGYGVLGGDVWKMIFLKRVGAIGGDYLACNEYGCIVNDKYRIGKELPVDKRNSAFNFYGYVPFDYFVPVGESVRSYDTRFAGFVNKNRIKGIVVGCLWKSKSTTHPK